jgi:hypothetical protein
MQPATSPRLLTAVPRARGATRRPRAVSFAAWVLLVEALVLVGSGALALLPLVGAANGAVRRFDLLLGALAFVVGWQVLVAALGVYWQRPWGWSVAMTLQALSLAEGLANYVYGHPDYVLMLAGVVVVAVLNQEEVREAFGARSRR